MFVLKILGLYFVLATVSEIATLLHFLFLSKNIFSIFNHSHMCAITDLNFDDCSSQENTGSAVFCHSLKTGHLLAHFQQTILTEICAY